MPPLTSVVAGTASTSTSLGLGLGIPGFAHPLLAPTDHPPERFCHLVHGVPRGHLEEALRTARRQGAATVWSTNRTDRGGRIDPWETMPGYWDDIVSRLGTGVSE